jgi:glycosyltransferase involved in cell wall biosynthesis
MKIAFDAKRAYHNGTGLGHYSRTLINSMAQYYPQNEYYLCNPKPTNYYSPQAANIHELLPTSFLSKKFSSIWRSKWVINDLQKLGIEMYHGLSHEIPLKLHKTGIKSIVTMHDLIHERYPEQYNKVDRKIYTQKFTYACNHANKIIAISQQTKADLIAYYKIQPDKIAVCYQSCNPAFAEKISGQQKKAIRAKYNLPEKYYLYVGSLIERKNALTICKAIKALDNQIPLVIIGQGNDYAKQVMQYVEANHLQERVIFLSYTKAAQQTDFKSAKDFPAIYQSAIAMIYPSIFEGFGIPILEALWSRIPVITSNISCLPEAAGEGSILLDPYDVTAMANGMHQVAVDENLRLQMIDDGWQHANQFTNEKCVASVMQEYQKLILTSS